MPRCKRIAKTRIIMHTSRMTTFDDTDRRLLSALQSDSNRSAEDLSRDLGLSPSQIGRRRHRLETAGAIEGYRARLSARALGLDVQAFVQVQLTTHDPERVKSLLRIFRTRPEIVSAWTLTGEADYLLRVFCADLAGLNTLLHQTLLPHPVVARVQSQIVMDQLKSDAPLPV